MKELKNLQSAQCTPRLICLEEFSQWIIFEDEHVLVMNKPGWVVCHPSKHGPLSSLVGAAKLHTGIDRLHLVSRLDRETSGVVMLAKHRKAARALQMAFQERRVEKIYYAIVVGECGAPFAVDQPLAKDLVSPVAAKVTVRASRTAKQAHTHFAPVAFGGGYTLLRVTPITGRKHQIRAHALYAQYPLVGDKIYGPDDTLFLEFIEHGWTERLQQYLPLRRQALHAASLNIAGHCQYQAPLAADMVQFCTAHGINIEDADEKICAR